MTVTAPTTATVADTAVSLSWFTQAVYDQFAVDVNQINPASIANLPPGYQVIRNIQMPDVAIGSKTPELYGILAASTGDNARQVVAIRGTATVTEWWDNIHFLPVPFQNVRGGGHVSEGFNEIYQGMTSTDPRDRTAATSPLFEHIDPGIPLVVTGHSLGGALVTLMALDMFVNSDLQPEVWTLGSPKVGDAQFAATYGQHSHVSWRIYNIPDVIPKVPIDPFDNYQDVNTGYPINSGHLTRLSLGCFHHLTTYMSVLSGGTVPLDPSCT